MEITAELIKQAAKIAQARSQDLQDLYEGLEMQRKYGQIADDRARSAKLAESTLAKLQLPLHDQTVVELAKALQELMDKNR